MDYKRGSDGKVINTNTYYHEVCGRLAIIQYLMKHKVIYCWDNDVERKITINPKTIDHEKTVSGSSMKARSDIICRTTDDIELHIEIVNTNRVSKNKFKNYQSCGCILICVYIKDIINEFHGNEEKIRKEIRKELGCFDFNKRIIVYDYSLKLLDLNKEKIYYSSYFEDSQSVVFNTPYKKKIYPKVRNEHVQNMLAVIYGKENVIINEAFYGIESVKEYLDNN